MIVILADPSLPMATLLLRISYMSVDRTRLAARARGVMSLHSGHIKVTPAYQSSCFWRPAGVSDSVTGLWWIVSQNRWSVPVTRVLHWAVRAWPVAVALPSAAVIGFVLATMHSDDIRELFPRNLAIANPSRGRGSGILNADLSHVFGWLIGFFDKSAKYDFWRLLRIETHP